MGLRRPNAPWVSNKRLVFNEPSFLKGEFGVVPAFMPRARSKTSSKTAAPAGGDTGPRRQPDRRLCVVSRGRGRPLAVWVAGAEHHCVLVHPAGDRRRFGLRPGSWPAATALLLGVGLIVLCYGFVLHEQLSDRPLSPRRIRSGPRPQAAGRRAHCLRLDRQI